MNKHYRYERYKRYIDAELDLLVVWFCGEFVRLTHIGKVQPIR